MVVLAMACTDPMVPPSTRAGIQIGQESGGCDIRVSELALSEVGPGGVRPADLAPEAGWLDAALMWADGGTTTVSLVAVPRAAWVVSWVPVNLDYPEPCAPMEDELEVEFTGTVSTLDGALDEGFAASGPVTDGGVNLSFEVAAADLTGAYLQEGLTELGFAISLLPVSGVHRGEVVARGTRPSGRFNESVAHWVVDP